MNTESYQVIIQIIHFFCHWCSLHELSSKSFFQTGILFIKSTYNNLINTKRLAQGKHTH